MLPESWHDDTDMFVGPSDQFVAEKGSTQSLVRFFMAGHSFLAARCGIKLASLLARIH
jgi:hypothetical protein